MNDREYMQRAIELAGRGEGWVNPNPLVGAVIVKNGRIIGEGWHRKYGQLHAERDAIAALTEPAEGATIYVTLEPCCHYGKQPPCTLAIVEHGIRKVVIGSRDPNPKVAGKGVRMLREHGIEVVEDFMRDECDALNPFFFHYITTGTPYVLMKYAMTADGKIATRTGASKWISGEASRERAHRWRKACMGIMVGIGTVLADDPTLNCRIEGGKDPIRIICDSSLRIPENSRICRTAGNIPTIIVCALPQLPEGEIDPAPAGQPLKEGGTAMAGQLLKESRTAPAGQLLKEGGAEQTAAVIGKIERLLQNGITVLNLPSEEEEEDGRPKVSLQKLMKLLGGRGIDSILLEGGGTLNESALREGIVQEVNVFIAPKIFGGQAKTPVEGLGVELPSQALEMKMKAVEMVGDDILITYRVKNGDRPRIRR